MLKELHDEDITSLLLSRIGPAFADRPGGYTRILRHAKGRLGDNAPTAVFELVDYSADAEVEPEEAAAESA